MDAELYKIYRALDALDERVQDLQNTLDILIDEQAKMKDKMEVDSKKAPPMQYTFPISPPVWPTPPWTITCGPSSDK
jgi:hypothetical protein